jgi:hypothetical protein
MPYYTDTHLYTYNTRTGCEMGSTDLPNKVVAAQKLCSNIIEKMY